MRDLIRETVFGRIVHSVSGGKLFLTEEQIDPSLAEKYKLVKTVGSSSSSLSEDGEAPNELPMDLEKTDPEKGQDFQLVDWTENDQQVGFCGP